MRSVMGLVIIAGCCLTGAGRLAAQQSIPWDHVDEIVARRPLDSIRIDREDITRRKGAAEARAGSARLRMAELEDRMERMKEAIEAADQKVKAAKDQKQEAEKVVAEGAKKRLERQRKVVEKRRELWEAWYEEGRAEAEYAERAARAFEFEYELERRRQAGTGTDALAELVKKAVEGQIEAARARNDLMGRSVRVAERRLSLHEAQQEMVRER